MKNSGWYNGYSWRERYAKLSALKARVASGLLPPAAGPCQLCGDPDVPVEYHDEDYSQPYLWGPPALFALCRHCHRDKLHKRFSRPHAWLAFLEHVRRGGYAKDLITPSIKLEVSSLARAIACNESAVPLPILRAYSHTPGQEWFAALNCDPITIGPDGARPRP